MTALNKDTLKEIIAKAQAALDGLGIEGIKFQLGNCTFDPASASMKLSIVSEEGNAEFLRGMAKVYGIASIEANGNKITDFNGRGVRMPIHYKNPQGVGYKTTVEGAKKIFGAVQA